MIATIRTHTSRIQRHTPTGARFLAAAVYLFAVSACDRDTDDTKAISRRPADIADATAETTERPILLIVAAVAPEENPEGGIVSRSLPGPQHDPGPHARGDVIHAAAPNLAALLSPGLSVQISGARAVLDGRVTEIPAHLHDGIPYVDVKSFARRFGAYTHVTARGTLARIFPRDVLEFMRAGGNTTADAYRGAVAEGLIRR